MYTCLFSTRCMYLLLWLGRGRCQWVKRCTLHECVCVCVCVGGGGGGGTNICVSTCECVHESISVVCTYYINL